jgi:hypothetical protein
MTHCMSPGLDVSLTVIEYDPWTVFCRRYKYSRATFKQLHKFCCDLISFCAILCCGNINFLLLLCFAEMRQT